ncbi:MAG: HAMP domain-containing sensor histidine kinase [Aliidongia sp.]
MSPTELLRATTFRLVAALAGLFGASTLLIFAFIYWQTAGSETRRIEALIAYDAKAEAGEPRDLIERFVTTRVTNDFHHLTYAALFDADGKRIAGDLDTMPPDLPPDGQVHVTRVTPPSQGGPTVETVRAVERRLADGSFLVIGRRSEELERLREEVARALGLGLLPAVLLSLATGTVLSWRANQRVKEVNDTAERIMRGQLRERLPVHGKADDFDRLSGSVNRMLDEIERLLDEIKGTGDEIAHDLRTPLTRVRARLENARRKSNSIEELEAAVDKSMVGLDQALAIITALLRIREIEAGRRRTGFGDVDLAEVVAATEELYQPIAEDRDIRLVTHIEPLPWIFGDHDLLFEMIGNLVDNALKFTPPGGTVTVTLEDGRSGPVLCVADSGPGILPEDRERVLLRFFRSARNQHVAGVGLGLSLVSAIAKLHEIRIVFADAQPGCIVELHFEGSTRRPAVARSVELQALPS